MNKPDEGWTWGEARAERLTNPVSDNFVSTSGNSWEDRMAVNTSETTSRPFCSVTQGVVTAATGAGLTLVLRRAFTGNAGISSGSSILQGTETASVTAPTAVAAPVVSTSPPPQPDAKPAHDVVAGAVARAASQGTIHPLDTMKVRMQAGDATRSKAAKAVIIPSDSSVRLQRGLSEVKGLYKGVVGAATGAGIIIGTYFAFYSTSKRFLREHSNLNEGSTAFVAGATAALGSSVVKVPLAVCIRSVQAGVYKNVFHAAKSIVSAAGVRGLFTGFLPTILEDVPDMAVKFAVYETMRKAHGQFFEGRSANVAEDLIMGGFAGAAAAAATTPLDVVKTVMMCSASSRPTFAGAAKSIMRDGRGIAPFFRGVGPRALSNGLNSAIFFCFFEAIRQVLIKKQAAVAAAVASEPRAQIQRAEVKALHRSARAEEFNDAAAGATLRPVGSAAACLSLALPVPGWQQE